jgi:hypothetical protein
MKRIDTSSRNLALVCQRLEAWRQHRPGRSRIPEDFWADAMALAQTEGVSRVSRVLRLPYQRLKDRLASVSPGPAPAGLPAFVELALPPTAPRGPKCHVELTHPTGTKMTIHFVAGSFGEVLPLAEAFWQQRR